MSKLPRRPDPGNLHTHTHARRGMTSKELVITAVVIAVIVVVCLVINVINNSGDRETAEGLSTGMMVVLIVAALGVLGLFFVGLLVQLNKNSPTVGEWVTGRDRPTRSSPPPPPAAPLRAFPVTPLEFDPAAADAYAAPEARGPATDAGRFRVTGVDRASRFDTIWHCTAESEANARVKAELEGIVVTRVERVG